MWYIVLAIFVILVDSRMTTVVWLTIVNFWFWSTIGLSDYYILFTVLLVLWAHWASLSNGVVGSDIISLSSFGLVFFWFSGRSTD